ncbi:MAG: methylated-DNA--[protein]-cysteine S-methyltransferase [Cyanobacteria bacterium]|nr:methylated-DNA--[protein]-cysteine S-methyltransferase [Cyanobacteriota bacterium]
MGELLLTSDGKDLTGTYVRNEKHCLTVGDDWIEEPDLLIFKRIKRQLEEYFSGRRTEFELENVLPSGTEFQRQVWKELTKIPFGETITYGELARRVDRPKAIRAVGQANGRNPISIIIPCHRVIGANGSLTGYGGGLSCKRFLLDLEISAFARARDSFAASMLNSSESDPEYERSHSGAQACIGADAR